MWLGGLLLGTCMESVCGLQHFGLKIGGAYSVQCSTKV